MAVFKVFLRTFVTTFLGIMLLVNLLMFSTYVNGVHPLAIPTMTKWDFTQYYFGFTSLQIAIADFGDVGSFNQLLTSITELNNYLVNSLPPINGEPSDILQWLSFIANAITFPIQITYYALKVLIYVVQLIVSALLWLNRLVSGYYNIPRNATSYINNLYCYTFHNCFNTL